MMWYIIGMLAIFGCGWLLGVLEPSGTIERTEDGYRIEISDALISTRSPEEIGKYIARAIREYEEEVDE